MNPYSQDSLDFATVYNNAEAAWKKIDRFIAKNPGKPIPVSKNSFDSILMAISLDINGYVNTDTSPEEFARDIKSERADTRFFLNLGEGGTNYQTKYFLIEGQETNNGKGVIGSTVNYIGIGMFTSAGQRPSLSIPGMVLAWNLAQAARGNQIRHNLKQIKEGTDWANVGFDFDQNTKTIKE